MTAIRPPAEIKPIVELVGEAAALQLVEAFGGLRIEVPSRVSATGVLGRAVGVDAAQALVKACGGARLYVPLCKRWRGQVMRQAGASYAEIARRLNVSEQTVWNWLDSGGMTGQPGLPGL